MKAFRHLSLVALVSLTISLDAMLYTGPERRTGVHERTERIIQTFIPVAEQELQSILDEFAIAIETFDHAKVLPLHMRLRNLVHSIVRCDTINDCGLGNKPSDHLRGLVVLISNLIQPSCKAVVEKHFPKAATVRSEYVPSKCEVSEKPGLFNVVARMKAKQQAELVRNFLRENKENLSTMGRQLWPIVKGIQLQYGIKRRLNVGEKQYETWLDDDWKPRNFMLGRLAQRQKEQDAA